MNNTISMPLQYKRLYNGPLDKDDVFHSLKDAESYASSPTAYAGHIISVIEGDLITPYIVTTDGKLKMLSTSNNTNPNMDEILNLLSWIEIKEDKNIIYTKDNNELVTKNNENISIKEKTVNE